MKIIFRSAAIAALIIATSCGKDKVENVAEQFEKEAIQKEQMPLEANGISENVIIAGGTKKEGTPPTPNEAISMDISKTGKTAFLNEGFDITLSSDGEIVGAYIQFKANDGTVSDNYYDVDLAANTQSGKSDKSAKGFGHNAKKGGSLFAKNDEEITLDVDFNANIEPGTFCYVVCVYDADGNISAPVEVCATVESWGGNAALVSEWNLVRSEYTYNGETEVSILNEEVCDSSSVTCSDSETSVDYTSCETLLGGKLILNADGTYAFVSEEKEVDIDYDATLESCTAVYEQENKEVYKSDGFWAYSEKESRFTLVEYSWSETDNGVVSESETYAEGDAYLLFDGKIELKDNAFQISGGEGEGTETESFKTFFEK